MSSRTAKMKAAKRQAQADATARQRQAAQARRSNWRDRSNHNDYHQGHSHDNTKTRLCDMYQRNGYCPYGNRCHYAHGTGELRTRQQRKINSPCWYFNQGSCSKSASDCVYKHVKVPNMRKPLHIQHPCPYFHYRTPGYCRRGDGCGGDHSYELTRSEWKHHFPDMPFPGIGYLRPRTRESKPKVPSIPVTEDFPMLAGRAPKQTPVGSWGRPLTIQDTPEPVPEPVVKSKMHVLTRESFLNPAPVPTEQPTPQTTDPEKPESPRRKIPQRWSDSEWPESGDDDFDADTLDSSDHDDWWGSEEEPELDDYSSRMVLSERKRRHAAPAPILHRRVAELEDQVRQLSERVGKDQLPAVDGELKELVTTALHQLLAKH